MDQYGRDVPPYDFEQLELYRKQAICAARELRYGEQVHQKLENAETIGEITRIMKSARIAFFEKFDEMDRRHAKIKEELKELSKSR